MQFLNIAKGDAPYFAELARTYTLSDNFHQAVMGGTGANHIMLGFGDPAFQHFLGPFHRTLTGTDGHQHTGV